MYRNMIRFVAILVILTLLTSVTTVGTASETASISEEAFIGCTDLVDITIEGRYRTIGERAYKDCTGLETVVIEDGIISIGNEAFSNCPALDTVYVPDSVSYIAADAFESSDKLTFVCSSNSDAAYYAGRFNIECEYTDEASASEDFKYTVSDGKVTINEYRGNAENVVIPDTIEGYPVVAIDDEAFIECYSIENVVIGNNVEYIGSYAFAYCGYIRMVVISDSVKEIGECAFEESNLAFVEFGNGVEKIGYRAFRDCNLTFVNLPESLIEIDSRAFDNNDLARAVIHSRDVEFGYDCFDSEIVIYGYENSTAQTYAVENGYEFVLIDGNNAYAEFDYTISDGKVTLTGYCGLNTDIVIPASFNGYPVVGIAAKAFENYEFTSVRISEGIEVIGEYAFNNCLELERVEIPASVSSIGEKAFGAGIYSYDEGPLAVEGSMQEFIVDAGNAVYADVDGILVTKADMKLVRYPCGRTTADVVIPDGITAVCSDAFENCNNIVSITLPGSVAVIEDIGFSCCFNLQNVVISEGATVIGNKAFDYCSELTSVQLPESVNSIGVYAFHSDCKENMIVTAPEGSYAWEWCASNGFVVNGMQSVAEGDFEYMVIGDELALTAYKGTDTDVTIPAEANGMPVTAILDNVFYENESIVSVTIPEGVTAIGESAFWGCYVLENVVLPSTLTNIHKYAFGNCDALASLILPEGLKIIGDGAFAWNDSLTEITIPASVEYVGRSILSRCEALVKANVNSGKIDVSANMFYGCYELKEVTLTEGTKVIGSSAFEDCSSLTGIVLPDSVTTIERCAFRYCGEFGNVVMPANLKYIGYAAFEHCLELESITLPEGTLEIGSDAFMECDKLRRAYIPESIQKFGNLIFDCTPVTIYGKAGGVAQQYAAREDLAFVAVDVMDDSEYLYTLSGNEATVIGYTGQSSDLVIPDNINGYPVVAIAAEAFCMTGIESVVIPDTVRTIGEFAFYSCYDLAEVRIPASVTSIGRHAFLMEHEDYRHPQLLGDGATGCIKEYIVDEANPVYKSVDGMLVEKASNKLLCYPVGREAETVVIPDGIQEIAVDAFYNCWNIRSVTVPEGVVSIGREAFYYCEDLTDIRLPASVEFIGYNAFYKYTLEPVVVTAPAGSYAEKWCVLNDFELAGQDDEQNITIDGIVYMPIGDKLAVVGYEGSEVDVVIPAEADGKKVTMIGGNAFYDTDIVSVVIPEGVTTIGYMAFGECNDLVSVTLPDSLVRIEASAFMYDDSLAAVELPDGLLYIGERAFYSCDMISKLIIPETVEFVGEFAFGFCYGLTSITIQGRDTVLDGDPFAWINGKCIFYGHADSTAEKYVAYTGGIFEYLE